MGIMKYIFWLFGQVPFGQFAFMPGKLYHTNEVLILLGDNWFTQRTAKQAIEMVERRKKC